MPRALPDVLDGVVRDLSLENAIHLVAASIKEIVGECVINVYQYMQQENTFRFLPSNGTKEETRFGHILPRIHGVGRSVMGKLEKGDQSPHIVIDDVQNDKTRSSPTARLWGVQVTACIGLVCNQSIVGLLYLHFKHGNQLSDRQIEQVKCLCSALSIVMEYARIHDAFIRTAKQVQRAMWRIVADVVFPEVSPKISSTRGVSLAELSRDLPGGEDELKELISKSFFDQEKVILREMAPGLSGARIVKVERMGPDRSPVALKFGIKQLISLERERFETCVLDKLNASDHPHIRVFAESENLAAITYTFIHPVTEFTTWRNFYKSHDQGENEGMIERLIMKVCGPWYENMRGPDFMDLKERYQDELSIPTSVLDESFAKYYGAFHGRGTIELPEGRVIQNPIEWMKRTRIRFSLPVNHSIVHGDLRHSNILTSVRGRIYIIDFQATNESHALKDLAMLESTLKFELLEMDDGENVDAVYEFERRLLSHDRYSDFLRARERFDDAGLRKAYGVIKKIREKAIRYTHGQDSLREYYIALFFHAVKFLRSKVIPMHKKLNRDHALISAGILSERIERMSEKDKS